MSDLREDVDKSLFFKNADESLRHTGHFVIAGAVLKELVYSVLDSREPQSQEIRELLFCNEVPFREIAKLQNIRTPLGQQYFYLFDMIRENSIGGTLEEKKSLLKFVMRTLRLKFPDEPILTDSKITFTKIHEFSDTVSRIHNKLREMLCDKPITFDNIEADILVFNAKKIIWKLLLLIGSDIARESRPGH